MHTIALNDTEKDNYAYVMVIKHSSRNETTNVFFRKIYIPNELHNKLQETREEKQELINQIKEKEKENEL